MQGLSSLSCSLWCVWCVQLSFVSFGSLYFFCVHEVLRAISYVTWQCECLHLSMLLDCTFGIVVFEKAFCKICFVSNKFRMVYL